MPAAKKTTPTPRVSKMAKLADAVEAVIKMVQMEKPPVKKIVAKLESVKNKLTPAEKKPRAAKELTAYQKFVKQHMKDKALEKLPVPQRFKKIAQMWKASQ